MMHILFISFCFIMHVQLIQSGIQQWQHDCCELMYLYLYYDFVNLIQGVYLGYLYTTKSRLGLGLSLDLNWKG